MRQVFIICTILVQLLGYISAEAKTGVPTIRVAQKESPHLLPSSFQQEHPADLSSNYFAGSSFKARHHRILPALTSDADVLVSIPIPSDKQAKVYSSPLFLPLIRSLLFPNHYFW